MKLPGGFRINFSKSGIGYSWGIKGFRVTKTAKETTRTTTSIPGTGISYVTESKSNKRPDGTKQNIGTNQHQEITDNTEKSYFDGTVLQHFGYCLLAGMFTAITFGIGAPWAYCGFHRWAMKHTVINSRRLEFDGEGFQLFWVSLKFIFFTIITLGIYVFWVPVRFNQWVVSHTHFKTTIPSSVTADAYQSVQPEQSAPTYTPQAGSALAPRATPWEAPEKDWVDKITPVLPLVYVFWFCGIAAGTFFLLSLIFKSRPPV